jgi:hypothetical protein
MESIPVVCPFYAWRFRDKLPDGPTYLSVRGTESCKTPRSTNYTCSVLTTTLYKKPQRQTLREVHSTNEMFDELLVSKTTVFETTGSPRNVWSAWMIGASRSACLTDRRDQRRSP